MAQDDLIPFSERSKDEAKELGQKGGIASGAVRRKKAAMRDYVQFILGMKRKVLNLINSCRGFAVVVCSVADVESAMIRAFKGEDAKEDDFLV